MIIDIVPIESLSPSTYNPRKADPVRLDLVETSLKKLGFLSPIFADMNGEILSGHQRHHVAQRIGMPAVPVHRLPVMPEHKRKALNLVFNRATNDMDSDSTSGSLADEMRRLNIRKMSEQLPDQTDIARCSKSVTVTTKKIIQENKSAWIQYAAQVAKTLRARGVMLPIICTKDNQVINGIGRLQVAAEKKDPTVQVVYIEDHEADFAKAMLNLLSMDFDLHTRYADLLRYSSFRRPITYRAGLGKGFYAHHFGNVTTKVFNIDDPVTKAKWQRHYGKSVVDFGAGRFTDTKILQGAGINVTPFEPFPVSTGNDVNKSLAEHTAKNLFAAVARGKKFDAVFISSVLNSVPFRKDREHIATIAASLCGDHGTCYAWTMADNHGNWKAINKKHRNSKHESLIQFRLDYEQGILVGDLGNNPKVQKFHTSQELYHVFKTAFDKVQVKRVGVDLALTAKTPIYSKNQLIDALEFEFNLPYPDGSTLNLAEKAKEAFKKRGCL